MKVALRGDLNGVGSGVFKFCMSRPMSLIPFLFRPRSERCPRLVRGRLTFAATTPAPKPDSWMPPARPGEAHVCCYPLSSLIPRK